MGQSLTRLTLYLDPLVAQYFKHRRATPNRHLIIRNSAPVSSVCVAQNRLATGEVAPPSLLRPHRPTSPFAPHWQVCFSVPNLIPSTPNELSKYAILCMLTHRQWNHFIQRPIHPPACCLKLLYWLLTAEELLPLSRSPPL